MRRREGRYFGAVGERFEGVVCESDGNEVELEERNGRLAGGGEGGVGRREDGGGAALRR